jgi:hypothetical protein
MKTRNLLLTLGAAAFAAVTINATASDALLSPRAAGNQIKQVSGTNNDPNLLAANNNVSPSGALLSPRAAGNQIRSVASTSNDVNPAMACARNMTASPKAVQACVESGTMSGCKSMAVASAK